MTQFRTIITLSILGVMYHYNVAAKQSSPPPPPQDVQELSKEDKENAQKMMIMKGHMKSLKTADPDVLARLGKHLHEANVKYFTCPSAEELKPHFTSNNRVASSYAFTINDINYVASPREKRRGDQLVTVKLEGKDKIANIYCGNYAIDAGVKATYAVFVDLDTQPQNITFANPVDFTKNPLTEGPFSSQTVKVPRTTEFKIENWEEPKHNS